MPSSWAVDCGELLPTSPPPEPEVPVETLPPSEDVEESFGGIIADAEGVNSGNAEGPDDGNAESPDDGHASELHAPPPSPPSGAAADAVLAGD